MKRIAVYSSVLYGADFIVESIESVQPYVDHVYVILMQRPWGNTDGVTYRAEYIRWPERFDDIRERIAILPEVTAVEAQKDTPWNRWGYAVNDILREQRGVQADEVILIDPDCVFSDRGAYEASLDWDMHPEYQWASVGQIELWRTPAWQVVRPRSMVSFHRGGLSLISSPDPPEKRTRPAPRTYPLGARVHNLGFCVSEATMRWKHLTALAFSPVIGESLPNPDWFENKWKTWHPVTNNKDLEISIRCESAIPKAVPYDVSGLPASIKKRYDAGEWRTSW